MFLRLAFTHLFFFLPFTFLTELFPTVQNICFIVQAVVRHKTLWMKKWAAFRHWIGANHRKRPGREVNPGAVEVEGGVTLRRRDDEKKYFHCMPALK